MVAAQVLHEQYQVCLLYYFIENNKNHPKLWITRITEIRELPKYQCNGQFLPPPKKKPNSQLVRQGVRNWLVVPFPKSLPPSPSNLLLSFFFSSSEQCSQRAIVLPPASALAPASTNVKVFVKVFKTSLFPNLTIDLIHLWYDDTYWSKILHSTIPTTLGHVKVKVTDLEFSC